MKNVRRNMWLDSEKTAQVTGKRDGLEMKGQRVQRQLRERD